MEERDYFPDTEVEVEKLLGNINDLIELADGEVIDFACPKTKDSPVSLENLFEMDFYDQQIEEIALGFRHELDASIYAKECYNWMQMREIRLGLLAEVDVTHYLDYLYSAEQMHEIRMGLEMGLDVSEYANLIFTATDMKKKRHCLLEASYALNSKLFEKRIVDEDTNIEITIPANHMEAYIKLPKQIITKVTVNGLIKLLKKYEVEIGIQEDILHQIVKRQIVNKKIKVAEGIPPLQGKDGWYETFFKENSYGKPLTLPDGRVEYSYKHEMETVEPGKVLAVYHPAIQGKDGCTVTGISVAGSMGNELPQLKGHGISINVKKGEYTAEIKGCADYNKESGTLSVYQVYNINNNVTRYSGNIFFDGTILIHGSVDDMSVVQASGDIIVDGFVSGAFLRAGGNIVLRMGVNAFGRGSIEAGGKIAGAFFEMANLRARDSIEGNYFLNCNISTDNKLLAKGTKGRIMGGNVNAVVGVESVDISNAGQVYANISAGDMEELEHRITILNNTILKTEEDSVKLQEGKDKLIQLFGEEVAAENEIYMKTCTAINELADRKEKLSDEIAYLRTVKCKAIKSYIKITGTMEPYVYVNMNGKKMQTHVAVRGKVLTIANIKSIQ